jgi:hypothetical protein
VELDILLSTQRTDTRNSPRLIPGGTAEEATIVLVRVMVDVHIQHVHSKTVLRDTLGVCITAFWIVVQSDSDLNAC